MSSLNVRDTYNCKNGGKLLIPQSTRDHLLAHPDVGDLIEEATARLELPGGAFLARAIDLSRPIGLSGCVPAPRIERTERTTFALRVQRPRPSRVAVGVSQVPTTEFAFIAKPSAEDPSHVYVLITCWVGGLAPKEPGDAAPGKEFEEAFEFWATHALVYDQEVMGPVLEMSWDEVLR